MPVPEPSSRARAVGTSATLAIAAKAIEMRRQGLAVLSLSAGEPDFPTPEDVAEAGIEAIRKGRTRYTAAAGMPRLRAAAARWFATNFGLDYQQDEVMVTAGVKAALHMALLTLLEPGDRVLLPAPYWVSYPDLVTVAGGEPVILEPVPEQGFLHEPEQIAAAACQDRVRGILINSPNNPSGAVFDRRRIESLVEIARAHDLWILSDEIYATMIYDGREHVSPASLEDRPGRVLVVNGGTKSHSFTGWRIGFLAARAEIIAAAARLQSQVIGNPCTISQEAAMRICEGDHQDEIARRMQALDERRRLLVERVGRIDGLEVALPQGAFYALVDARKLCERAGTDDAGLAARLLEEALVAVVPGSPFGIPGFLRLSYAASLEEIEVAVSRINRFVSSLEGPSP